MISDGGDYSKEGRRNTMGDKSPKAARKHASQKLVKSDRAEQQKRQDVAAKQLPSQKK